MICPVDSSTTAVVSSVPGQERDEAGDERGETASSGTALATVRTRAEAPNAATSGRNGW